MTTGRINQVTVRCVKGDFRSATPSLLRRHRLHGRPKRISSHGRERKRIAQTREQSSSDKLPIRSYVYVNSGWAESRRSRTETGTVSGLETVDRRPALRKRPTKSLSRPKEQCGKCCLTLIKLPLFECCLNSQLTTAPQ